MRCTGPKNDPMPPPIMPPRSFLFSMGYKTPVFQFPLIQVALKLLLANLVSTLNNYPTSHFMRGIRRAGSKPPLQIRLLFQVTAIAEGFIHALRSGKGDPIGGFHKWCRLQLRFGMPPRTPQRADFPGLNIFHDTDWTGSKSGQSVCRLLSQAANRPEGQSATSSPPSVGFGLPDCSAVSTCRRAGQNGRWRKISGHPST